jgi:heme-degrading monooxygenase HmoA
MIARLWHGTTPASKADAYGEVIAKTGIRDLRKTEGNRGAWTFRRIEGDVAHFIVLSMWDGMEAIERFAGPDPQKAFYYPEDDDYLQERARNVDHYDVVTGA